MNTNYQEQYIAISAEFRKSKRSNESIEKLYDLLYELEKRERNEQEHKILSYIYSLLEYHQSAYEIYKPLVDLKDKKDIAYLYKLQSKAKSHGNNFKIKDIRKYRRKIEQVNLSLDDFKFDSKFTFRFCADANKYLIVKNIIIFNKILKAKNFELWVYENNTLENSIEKIIDYIIWLGNCKNELIDFYNLKMAEDTEQADNNWFDTLDIYGLRISLSETGNISAFISVGDTFFEDHILDIEIDDKNIVDMNYDG
ncbi:hypothetical protein QJU43_05965 [Pasteurella atlantica]|uniref:hypothetical protein n=1 Tax=Pasteurellaceae TaxID=712 RepID=UPI00275C8B54|nr:hypothetical protein [Pasteurella atlantica]MDP8033926.1 hypothetical protein [Pasteurella atlantica]MDP8035800.1 hypothetical protein [Pasteurella atlantica]MDP8037810.1 hypothetical protein [Pasteurella atlantica]MDP8048214.1 hypothetical protein [Pasteurella atlantica]MDP8050174.1 hypothetical protein [Pasteurella atlantica]